MSNYASAIWKARMAELDARISGRFDAISQKTGMPFHNSFKDAMAAVSDTGGSPAASASSAPLSGVSADTILGLMSMNGGSSIQGLFDSDSTGLNLLSGSSENSAFTSGLDLFSGSSAGGLSAILENALGKSIESANSGASGALSSQYDSVIEELSSKYGVSPYLVKAVCKVESGFDVSAVSVSGAMGLMQLMPTTADELGVASPFDAYQNIEGGVICLLRHLTNYDGNVPLALAAYNCGAGTIENLGITDLSDPAQFGMLPSETRSYLNKIRGALASAGKGSIYTGG